IPQRARRPAQGFSRRGQQGETAASYSHGARREQIQWLPARSYRQWRDVGLRGYDAQGLPDPSFRGRWADRNALFADLMVRTGMRLAEQSSLTVFDIPMLRAQRGYHRFWLPGAVAKSGSARWIYVPASILGALDARTEWERRSETTSTEAQGRFKIDSEEIVLFESSTMASLGTAGVYAKLRQLRPEENSLPLASGTSGLEPGCLRLTEDGLP